MARPCQGWGPRPSSQIRVTPLGQKGSPAKGGVSRAAQRNFRATEDLTAIWQLFCSVDGEVEGLGHSSLVAGLP